MAPTAVDLFAGEVERFSGRILRSWQDAGLFALAEFRGLRHLFGWAPGVGIEHHALVPFALRSTVLLAWQQGGPAWLAGDDQEVARWMNGSTVLAGLAQRLSWTTVVAPGAPALQLDWVLQLRPAAGALGHLVLRAGDYGGRTGLQELLGTIEWMASAVPRTAHDERGFAREPAFSAPACLALGVAPATPGKAGVGFVPATGTVSAKDAQKLVGALQAAAPGPGEDEYSRRVNEAGRCAMRGKYDEFITIWASIGRDFADPVIRAQALYQLGAGYDLKKDYARAIELYEQARAAGYDAAEIDEEIASARKKLK